MPEVTEYEYRAKERERDNYQRDKARCEEKISSLNDEIDELDRAIKQMTQVYQDFKAQTQDFTDFLTEEREFKGNQYTKLIAIEGSSLGMEALRCQNRVNKALDDLEWLRNEKITKRNEQYGILGKIKSALSTIGTWLKTNFFNN